MGVSLNSGMGLTANDFFSPPLMGGQRTVQCTTPFPTISYTFPFAPPLKFALL